MLKRESGVVSQSKSESVVQSESEDKANTNRKSASQNRFKTGFCLQPYEVWACA